jgi:hypothetical protein
VLGRKTSPNKWMLLTKEFSTLSHKLKQSTRNIWGKQKQEYKIKFYEEEVLVQSYKLGYSSYMVHRRQNLFNWKCLYPVTAHWIETFLYYAWIILSIMKLVSIQLFTKVNKKTYINYLSNKVTYADILINWNTNIIIYQRLTFYHMPHQSSCVFLPSN